MANTNNAQAKRLAQQDLEDIKALKKQPEFQRYWGRRVLEEVEKRREKVLHDRELTPQKLWEERLLFLAAEDTAKLLGTDEAACHNIMESGAGAD